jgi:hypothetical protein
MDTRTKRITMDIKVKFNKWDCKLVFTTYRNNRRIAIELVEDTPPFFEPVAMATVNLPNEKMEPDEVAIKDYSENEGMLECLMKAGIISKPLRIVQSGFVSVPICKLLVKP